MNRKHREMRYAIRNQGFIAGTIVFTIVLFCSFVFTLLPNIQSSLDAGTTPIFPYMTKYYQFQKILFSPAILFCIPIVCTLPYTTAFINEKESGALKFYLSRMSRKNYVFQKLKAVFLSGGLVLLMGILLAHLITFLVILPFEAAPEKMQSSETELTVDQEALPIDPGMVTSEDEKFLIIVEILSISVRYFFVGAFWSLLGSFLANITMSSYMAYASPFVIYYILIILSERYIKNIYLLDPREWILGQAMWPSENWGILLFLTELIVIISFLFCLSVKRGIAHE